jgi:membrane associated rhomboid family serine protease
MFGNEYSEDQRPITYFRGYPVHAATLIVAIYIATMLATTLLLSAGLGAVGTWLIFEANAVWSGGEVWRFLTYGLWNPPSIGFVIDMFMIVWFGRELEKFFGRATFLKFYAAIYLLQPVLYALLALFYPVLPKGGETGAFALFIAFATLYPNVALLFNILAKWLAAILVGIYTLIALAAQDVVTLVTLWATVGLAFGWVRYEQGRFTLFTLPKIRFASRSPKLRVLPSPKAAPLSGSAGEPAVEMDALLDKIAKSGLASLTSKERAQLEKAREALIKKDQR